MIKNIKVTVHKNLLMFSLLSAVVFFNFIFCHNLLGQENQNKLTIDLTKSGRQISPDLLGIFFEDLNYAADGGLYAELIQNRSFEYSPTFQPDWHPLKFWDLEKYGDGEGSIGVANMRPLHKNNPNYAILTVTTAGDGVGISNTGFDSIPITAGEKYIASFWAYQAYMGIMWQFGDNSKPMPVTLRLETVEGELINEKSFVIKGRKWTKFETVFTPTKSTHNAKLILIAHDQGGICLDMISLFPKKTFKNHVNGLRKDLAEAIADIEPKFMRFPGGCLVHGQGIHQYYDWKHSIGPVEQRKSGRNLWGYDQTRGFGYYEFFQFCEDIEAIPIPVVTAGVCCQHAGSSPGRGQEGLPMNEMDDYIQDVLDLIEWANGDEDTKWGSKRAEAGHPKPFGLKYLGVGNEDAITPIFKERFKMIYNTLKVKHPEIKVIGTSGPFHSGKDYDNGWEFSNELNLDLVDEHYYVKPEWFWENLNRYDSYPRDKAKVYVGEYAAHDIDRKNTLRSALAEAAMLTSYERNGDIVQFASYAPMLSRKDHTQWVPDLIYFDAENVYLTPNYFVQQLFSQNSGDVYLESDLELFESTKLTASTVSESLSGDIIIKIVNGEDQEKVVNVLVNGSDENWNVTKTLLTGPNADSINKIGDKLLIQPVTSSEKVGNDFTIISPANSLIIYRLHK